MAPVLSQKKIGDSLNGFWSPSPLKICCSVIHAANVDKRLLKIPKQSNFIHMWPVNPGCLVQLSIILNKVNDAQMSTFHWGNFRETFAKAAVMADIGNCLAFKRMICCILRQQKAETSKCLRKLKSKEIYKNETNLLKLTYTR